MRPGGLVLATVLASLVAGCGYRLVQHRLPEPAGGCVRFEGLSGGGPYPQVAMWTSAALREEMAPDLCASGGGLLAGSVEDVEQLAGHYSVSSHGAHKMGGRWAARASLRIEKGGEVVWGPMGVEVERDFVTTGAAVTEQDAFEAHLKLIAEDLARAAAEVIYGVHPVLVEAAP